MPCNWAAVRTSRRRRPCRRNRSRPLGCPHLPACRSWLPSRATSLANRRERGRMGARRAEPDPKGEQGGLQAPPTPADTGTFRGPMSVAPGTEDATDRLRQIEAVTDAGLAHLDVE